MVSFIVLLCLALLVAGVIAHMATLLAALVSISRKDTASAITGTPGISVLRPVCGLENNLEETLRSTFLTTYTGKVELLFCCDRADDPVVPLVKRLIAEYPQINARLLIGVDKVSGNPKLNNLVKGWAASQYDYILMADSNVLLPADYLERLVARWTKDTGLVTSPPAGIRADNLWGVLETAFLNTYQGRFQLASDAVGNGFAQGKMLFWRRDICEAGGGLAALGRDMAEDVASTKLVRSRGLKVRLLGDLLPQPVGSRNLPEVWKRQVRWAKVRRMGFAGLYAAEILSGIFAPLLAAIILASVGAVGWLTVPALVITWFVAEWAFARLAGWPATFTDVLMWFLRDMMIPVIWTQGWIGKGFEWRGNAMSAQDVPEKARG